MGFELFTLGIYESVFAKHHARGGGEGRAAGIAEAITGSERGLFAHNTFAFDLMNGAVLIGNHPTTFQKRDGLVPVILDVHLIGPHKVIIIGIGPLLQKYWINADFYGVCDLCVHTSSISKSPKMARGILLVGWGDESFFLQ